MTDDAGRNEQRVVDKAVSSGVLLVAIVLLGMLTRVLMMIGRGLVIEHDESFYLVLARNLLSGVGYRLDLYPDIKYSPLYTLAISGVSFVVRNLIWSGRVVSIVMGGLTCIPFYVLLKELKGGRFALVGALFVSLIPQLQDFVLRSKQTRDFLYTGAEPIAFFFLIAGVALIVCSVRRRRKLLAPLSGVAFGLAYLARPECIVFGLVYAFGVVVLGVLIDRKSVVHRLICGALCVVVMVLVAMPYLLYLRKQAGVWALSGRTLISETRITGVEKIFDKGDWSEIIEDNFKLSPDNQHLESSHWGMSDYHRRKHPQGERMRWRPKPSRILSNSKRFAISLFWHICPVYLWPFLAFGVALSVKNCFRSGKDFEAEMLMLALIVPGVALVIRYRILPRYLLPLCFLVVYYAAEVVEFIDARCREEYGEVPKKIVVGGLSLLMVAHAFYPVIVTSEMTANYLKGAIQEDRVAEALAADGDEADAIMSFHAQPVLRAGRRWRTMPIAEPERIFEYALHTKTDFILFGPTVRAAGLKFPFHDAGFQWTLFDLRKMVESGTPLDEGVFRPGVKIVTGQGKDTKRMFLVVDAVPKTAVKREPKPTP